MIDFSLKQHCGSDIAAKIHFLFHSETPELLNEEN